MKPVLFVLSNYHPAVGGAEVQAALLAAALAERGQPVEVLTAALPGLPREDSMPSMPKRERSPERRAEGRSANGAKPADAPEVTFPARDLLSMPAQPEDLITAAELTTEANLLLAKLADFGIEGKVTEIHPGPVVTTFEFAQAAGVKVNQIVSREDDLALALRAQRIRIIAPI